VNLVNKLLEISELHIAFDGSEEAVKGVSMNVHKGEIVGVSGASGSGKSLTMWSILGILPAGCHGTGTFTFYNVGGEHKNIRTVVEMRAYAGQRITMIPQNPFTSLNPVFRCGDQIAEMLRQSGTRDSIRERVLAQLRDLRFEEPERIYDAYPFELSGGQLQRVVVAMATISDPELVIADEPTTALDVLTQTEVLDLLTAWVGEGDRSLILVSHDISLLKKYCQRIYAMRHGVIERSGTIAEMESWIQERVSEHPRGLSGRQPDNDVLCETNSLSVTYRGRSGAVINALTDINLCVHKGEAVGIVGSTGCGKSTLAKTLTGLVTPKEGTMIFAGIPIDYDRNPGLRRNIQMIFQDPYSALYPHRTVGQYLEEAIEMYRIVGKKEIPARIAQILEQVGLPGIFAHRYPHQLSGGERQRVQIARAILIKPQLLICDEISSGLDASIQGQILQLLKELHKESGMALIVISHNLNVIRYLTEYVFVLDAGRIAEEGDSGRIFADPQHGVTRALIHAQGQ